MEKIISKLPKIPQWESIPYVNDFTCPNCGNSAINGGFSGIDTKPNLVGWCETPLGYMAIFECPLCYARFRFHCSSSKKEDIDAFNNALRSYIRGKLIGNFYEFIELIDTYKFL